MPQQFDSLDALQAAAQQMRGLPGICKVPAALYRDFVVDAATGGLQLPSLAPDQERFLADACRSVDGLADDLKRSVYVPQAQLFRLSQYAAIPRVKPPEPGPPTQAEPAEPFEPAEPAEKPKPKRRRKPKPTETDPAVTPEEPA